MKQNTSHYSDLHRSIIGSFFDNKVEFVLIGGMAVRCYNIDRITIDMDLLVNNSECNASKIADSLISIPEVDFDQKVVSRFISAFKQTKQIYKLNNGSIQTDLMTPFSKEIEFKLIMDNSKEREMLGLPIKVASPEDLINLFKLAEENNSESSNHIKLKKLKSDIQFLKEYLVQ